MLHSLLLAAVLQGPFTVPITYANREIFIDARIGAQTLHLVLDSGSDFSISPDAAKRVGLQVTYPPGYQAYGASGKKMQVGIMKVAELHLGPALLRDQEATVLDVPPGCDGIIGYPIFSAYRSTIDVRANTLTLSQYDATPLDGTTIPLEFVRGHFIAVHGRVAGIPALFGIDLGFGGDVMLEGGFASRHGLLPANPSPAPGYSDIGGALKFVTIGPTNIQLGTLSLSPPTLVQLGGLTDELGGSIGMGVLEAYRIELDYSRREMGLQAL